MAVYVAFSESDRVPSSCFWLEFSSGRLSQVQVHQAAEFRFKPYMRHVEALRMLADHAPSQQMSR